MSFILLHRLAIARTNITYFPPTSYIGYSRHRHRYQQFNGQFKWLKNGAVFNNFTKDTDTRDIIKTLSRDVSKSVLQLAYDKHRTQLV
jgi:hypothetical protein